MTALRSRRVLDVPKGTPPLPPLRAPCPRAPCARSLLVAELCRSVSLRRRCASSDAILELIDHPFEIGKAGAKEHAGGHVSAAGGDRSIVRHHVKLTRFAGLDNGVDAEALLDEGDETRRLEYGAVSGGTSTDFDLHIASRSGVGESTLVGDRLEHNSGGREEQPATRFLDAVHAPVEES